MEITKMDVWTWIGLIWVMLGVAIVIADKIASPSSDYYGPHSPHSPIESLLYSIALIVGTPFITAFALAVCGKVIWEGKIPLSGRPWWPRWDGRFDPHQRDTVR